MAICTYDPSYWQDFDSGNSLEWVLTAGNGAYAGGSLIGGRNRTHQAYLVASLKAPTNRYAVLDNITEHVSIDGTDYDLEAIQHKGKVCSKGYKYLKKVTYDGTIRFEYELNASAEHECESGVCAMSLKKHIALVKGENTVTIDYEIINFSADEAKICLTPKFDFREHNTLKKASELNFSFILKDDTVSLIPDEKDDIRIDLSISEGCFWELEDKYDKDIELQTEVDLETEGLCDSFMPYNILIEAGPGESKHISVVCSVVSGDSGRFVAAGTARKLINGVKEYYKDLEDRAETAMNGTFKDPSHKELFDRLVLAADHFICERRSTGLKTVLAGLPWFTDWGRDTMIAFTGLTLCTGRFDDAREILKSFALYEKNGLIPNMFPDDGKEPLYNTADASLWFFIAVYNCLRYDPDSRDFIRTEIYPTLLHIITAYEKGTDNSIYMEESGLIHAGSGLDQVTWMDVRVGDLVVTPRHGCPVEINALWYNALRIAASLADMFGDPDMAKHCNSLSKRVLEVFEKTYFNPETGCLYDVVSGYTKDGYTDRDPSIIPNQVYAVSLPFSPLSEEAALSVVNVVEERLYVGVAIRSLDPSHPDYHPEYRGALKKRDMSYHQGTAWGFLLGAYIEAYYKVHSREKDIKERLDKLFEPVRKHLTDENCICGICEIFEGAPPHLGRGCYTQAWSVGEILRVLCEYLIGNE